MTGWRRLTFSSTNSSPINQSISFPWILRFLPLPPVFAQGKPQLKQSLAVAAKLLLKMRIRTILGLFGNRTLCSALIIQAAIFIKVERSQKVQKAIMFVIRRRSSIHFFHGDYKTLAWPAWIWNNHETWFMTSELASMWTPIFSTSGSQHKKKACNSTNTSATLDRV